jgi:ubiquitin-protein ligase
MNNTQKRILSDIKDIEESKKQLERDGIFVTYNEEDMFNFKAIVMGTKDTPYEFGFHYFDIKMPDVYPMKPPSVKYCTGDGKTRFNPNLYVEGKVCLSLLGTWHGPGWVPVYNLKTVLMTIQAAILNEDPLVNEPGYEKSTRVDLNRYNHIIEHQNIKVAVIKQLKSIEKDSYFGVFKEQMYARFRKDYPALMEKVCKLEETRNNYSVKSPIYGMNITTDYTTLRKDLVELGKKLKIPSADPEPVPVTAPTPTPALCPEPVFPDPAPTPAPAPSSGGSSAAGGVEISVKKGGKKTPNIPAKVYAEGYEMESDNHIVNGVKMTYVVTKRANGWYWKLKK